MEKKINPFMAHVKNKEKANEQLIDSAIKIINATGGELSPANVSKTTKEIDPIGKGISPSGISKNERHKNKIYKEIGRAHV